MTLKPTTSVRHRKRKTALITTVAAPNPDTTPNTPISSKEDSPDTQELSTVTIPMSPQTRMEQTRKETPVENRYKGGKPGRPGKKYTTEEERSRWRKIASERYQKEAREAANDITDLLVDQINWERRLSCAKDPQEFCKVYLPSVFYLGWSEEQLETLKTASTIFHQGGMFAIAMARGGGKTAICRGATLWGTANGLARFLFLIGSSDEKAKESLSLIKTYWQQSITLQQDYPEIGLPIVHCKGRPLLAKGITYLRNPTHLEWGTDRIRYPALLLPKEVGEIYLHPPRSDGKRGYYDLSKYGIEKPLVTWNDDYQAYIPNNSGVIINVSGIGGGIRGAAEVHPLTLEQMRPDIVLLDDVQRDIDATSPATCDKMERLIDGAITGLAGPDKKIGVLKPCTIIREDDVASRYLNPERKPDYRGKIFKLVKEWPEGITDKVIGQETKAGKLWNEYGELRAQSLRLYQDIRLATKYYKKNRKEMDKGFVCTWKDRVRKEMGEISPQQTAMNLRFQTPLTFSAEYQNNPLGDDEDNLFFMLTPAQCAKKIISTSRLYVPVGHDKVTAYIDVQNEIFFWMIMSGSHDFQGNICAYGTWPEITVQIFNKGQTEGWSLLSNAFFQKYPEMKTAAYRTSSGQYRAPLEAKIYFGLQETLKYLLSLDLRRDNQDQSPVQLNKVGIDTRWGLTTDVTKRFCREQRMPHLVVPCTGQYYSPAHKQLEEYTRTPGWLFEDQRNPNVKQVKWVFKPDQSGQYILSMDVNRLKDFFHHRLSAPMGHQGSISLYQASPDEHSLVSRHLCDSEYPVLVEVREIKKNQWQPRDGKPDNDWLDCAAGCTALLSMEGCALRTDDEIQVRAPRSIKQMYLDKKRGVPNASQMKKDGVRE